MQASVEIPPISGSLYNCALNCALPSIFQISRTFSQSNLPQFKAYVDLKNCFQQWYHLPELSWEVYNAIIAQHTHSENELLFAPVIRQFIAKQAGLIIAQQEAEEAQRARDQGKVPIRHANFGYIETLRDIVDDPLAMLDPDMIIAAGVAHMEESGSLADREELALLESKENARDQIINFYKKVLKKNPLNHGAGRYYALTSADANNYFYKPFGFHMHVLQFTQMQHGLEIYAPTGQGQIQPNSITVYLKNNHYELQQHHLSHGIELEDRYTKQEFETAFTNVGESKFGTNLQLAKIFTYVREHCYPQALSEYPAPPHAPHPELVENYHLEYFKIASKNKLHNDNPDGQLTFAVILLILMENSSLTKGSPATEKLFELSTCTDQTRIEAIIDETFGLCAGIAPPETSPPAIENPDHIRVGSGQPVINNYANPNSFWNSSLVRSTCLALLIADVVTNVVAAFVGGTLSAFLFSPPGIILSAIIAAVSLLVLYQKTTEPSAPSLSA